MRILNRLSALLAGGVPTQPLQLEDGQFTPSGLESLESRMLLSVNLLPLGDSITQADMNHNSYRRPLWHAIEQAGYDVDFIGSINNSWQDTPPPNPDFDTDHEGHASWTASDILNGRASDPGAGKLSDWLQNYTPDIVLIHLSTNDLKEADGPDTAPVIIGQIIDTLRADNPDVVIVLAQIIPGRRGSIPDYEDRILELNENLADLAANKNTAQSPVILVDQWTGFDIDQDTYDELHPDASGEQKMADKFFAALQPILDEIAIPEPGRITASVYRDANENGVRDNGEAGIANWQVYLDENDNGVLDGGEVSLFTDANGIADFLDLPSEQDYVIRVVAQPGEPFTNPVNGRLTTFISAGDQDDANFGVAAENSGGGGEVDPGRITATVYRDNNSDGDRDSGEAGLANWLVFLDENDNGVRDDGETQIFTDANGVADFFDLDPEREYIVRVLPEAGETFTNPVDGRNTTFISEGDQDDVNFGVAPIDNGEPDPGRITAFVYRDLNEDGDRDSGEPPLANWAVFLDENDNGIRDTGETQIFTDANGIADFFDLEPNRDYVVRAIPDVGETFVNPSDGRATTFISDGDQDDVNFGVAPIDNGEPDPGRITASVYRDLNEDGNRDSGEPGLANWLVFLDHNDNGVRDGDEQQLFTDINGIADFLDLEPNQNYIIRAVPEAGATFTNPADGRLTTFITEGDQDDANFGVAPVDDPDPLPGSISGIVYEDENENGNRDNGEAARTNWRVYIDENDNGVFDNGETNEFTDNNGQFSFNNLTPGGNYIIRVVEDDDQNLTEPGTEQYDVQIIDGDNVTDRDFGFAPVPVDPEVDAHGDSRGEATDTGLLDAKQVIQGVIGDGDEDFFKIKVGRRGGISIDLDQLSRDVDFEILNKKGKVLASSMNNGTDKEFHEMGFGRRGGVIFVRIFQPDGETRPTNYDLTLTPMTAEEAGPVGNTVDVGQLNDQSYIFNGDVGDYKPANDYQFNVTGKKSYVAIDVDNADDALVVQILNKKGKVLQTATAAEAQRITAGLKKGTYVARVVGSYFDEENYDITLESITEAEFRGVGTTTDLGTINGTNQDFNDTVGDPLPHDEYIFKVNGRRTDVSMILDNADESVVLQLMNKKGQIIDSASGAGARVLAKSLKKGTYVIRVTGLYENPQGYSLSVTA